MSNGKKSYSSVEIKRNYDNLFSIYIDGKEVARRVRQKDLSKKMKEVLRENE